MTLDYWLTRQATGENGHLCYLGLTEGERLRSQWLVERVQELGLENDAAIFEIGCGCGRNLWYLMRAGYQNVKGIEANRDRAVIACLSTGGRVANCDIEGFDWKIFWRFDLTYTMAVLEHVEDDEVIDTLAETSRSKYFLTIEGENKRPSSRHFPRNYGAIFCPHGWKQLWECDEVPGLGARCYVARLFERIGHGTQ